MRGFYIFILTLAFILAASRTNAQIMFDVTNSGQPTAINACAGSTVTALALSIKNVSGSDQQLNSMDFSLQGTGTGGDINWNNCSFYQDNGCTGVYNASDTLFTSDSFFFSSMGSDGLYLEHGSYNTDIPNGQTKCFLITFNFNPTVSIGKTYQLAIYDIWTLAADAGPSNITNTATSPLITLISCTGDTPTATNTATNTFTSTSTHTPTASPTGIATSTATASMTASASPTNTLAGPTATSTNTATSSFTPTRTATASMTSTSSPTLTHTPSGPTATFTNTSTATDSATVTASPTLTGTATLTSTSTLSSTATSTFTRTMTATITNSATPTGTFSPSFTPTATALNQVLYTPPYPNPSTGGKVEIDVTTPGAATIEMEVFTVAGRKIADHSFATGSASGPGGTVTAIEWELHDKMGMTVSNGLYYIRVHVTGRLDGSKLFKILVLR